MHYIKDPAVQQKFLSYPRQVKERLLFLRQLVIETALQTQGVGELEETLKWGEPSYLAKGGSTIRMDWKRKSPYQYALYFHCKTKLVDTFKELYGDKFNYDGDRAIVFHIDDTIAAEELKHCITMSLRYHHIKHLPMLGA